ncbi:uncharacterized protein LOC112568675 isoform X2 [Pomacea canaliculata]|uniref:uncharacterized protein LOC112568675 isoform X2 n=1 Tax=Pomacea canaliculata TaxID=400727 RepID=UPI000D738F71|nr:uncharacterized protein LOC112568675 isoform X2 [Pomacea canaliculata]
MFPGRTTALLVLFAPLADWSVSATCSDTSTAKPKKCLWDAVNTKTGQRVGNALTSVSDRSYFYCSETFLLPLSAGEYDYYILLPNGWTFAFQLQIVDPGEPTVEYCKHYVREGENVRCLCSTQNEGNPPPVISWEGQGTSPILLLDAVSREDSKNYKCKMIWGNRTKTVSYDLYVRTDSPVSYRLTTTVKPSTFLSRKPTTFYVQTFTESIDEVERDENKNASSLPIGIIVAAAAAVLVLNVATTVIVIFIIRRKRSRGGNAQNETANGNEGERTSKKSDSSTSSPGQAAGNGSKSGGSTPRSSSSGSDKPSTNPNYTSTALQEVEIHPYMDLHTRDPTYASTTSSKDPHMYMELKTLKALQPGSEKNGNDGYETPQVPGQANKSSDGYETPQPPREGRRRSATYANQGVPADPIQEEVNYYNEA